MNRPILGQLNEISSPTGDIKKTYSKKKFYIKTTKKLVFRHNCQEVSSCELTSDELPIGTKTPIGFLKVQSTVLTVTRGTLVAVMLLSPQQAQFLQLISPEIMNGHVNASMNEPLLWRSLAQSW